MLRLETIAFEKAENFLEFRRTNQQRFYEPSECEM